MPVLPVFKSSLTRGKEKMFTKTISPKVELAAQEYLASMDSSRQRLTDKQWKIVVNFVRGSRLIRPLVASFLLLGIGLVCLGSLYSHWTKREIAKAVPAETIFFYKAGERVVIPLRPYEIKTYLRSLTGLSFNTGPAFILAIFLFLSVLLIPLHKRANHRMLEAFIKPRPELIGQPDNL